MECEYGGELPSFLLQSEEERALPTPKPMEPATNVSELFSPEISKNIDETSLSSKKENAVLSNFEIMVPSSVSLSDSAEYEQIAIRPAPLKWNTPQLLKLLAKEREESLRPNKPAKKS